MNKITDEQLAAIAEDFETGWSDDRLDASQQTWGPALREVLPAELRAQLHRRAQDEGVTEIQIMADALKAYLAA